MNVTGPGGLPATYRALGVARPNRVGAPAAAPADTAPAGTDPALWSVLTTEERSYFERLSAMGPLTYGPAARPAAPSPAAGPLGQRIDLRA